jgi:hypothetical protein
MMARDNFEFRRRTDAVVYRFEACAPRDGRSAWKRVDRDLWLTCVPEKGWCILDAENIVKGLPWDVELARQGAHPPEGEWISKNGHRSYVYDLLRVDSSDAAMPPRDERNVD